MAAVTTVTGIGTWVGPATHRRAPREATPRGSRLSPATYRRRRLAAAALALVVVVVAGKAGVALGGSPPLAVSERRPTISTPAVVHTASMSTASPTHAGGRTVVVRPGDTLWAIAERAAPGEDPRPLVDELSAARNGAPLVPGESIRLPR
jgi:Tfp pilus assembly protein FimV